MSILAVRIFSIANAEVVGRRCDDQIDISIGGDPSDLYNKVQQGSLDFVDDDPQTAAALKTFRADPTLSKQMLRSPLLQARWIAFNVSKPPFDNLALREAIAYSIDRSRLADLAFSGTVESACTEAPPNMIWAGKPPFCWPSGSPAGSWAAAAGVGTAGEEEDERNP